MLVLPAVSVAVFGPEIVRVDVRDRCPLMRGPVNVIVAMPVGVVMVVIVRVAVIVIVRIAVIVIVRMAVVVIVIVAHPCAPWLLRSSKIRCTAIAAPKPLSMLTTTTPDAQLVSMAKSAVNPPSAVP